MIYIFFYEKQKAIRDKIIQKTISINKMYYIILLVVRLYPLLGCRRAHVLFMLYVFVWFVFTPYLAVGWLMSYLWYMCLLFIVVSNTYILYICVTWRVSYKRQ
jgi:hypothetical protein